MKKVLAFAGSNSSNPESQSFIDMADESRLQDAVQAFEEHLTN